MPDVTDGFCPHRRAVIAALPGLILLPGVIAACSSTSTTASSASSESPPTAASEPAAASTSVPQAQVPVGTAVVIAGTHPYVVAQPTPGQFVAFSAACTHRGTTVGVGQGTTLICPAHGSQFDAATGAVLKGPASRPLASVPVSATNGQLTIG